jgi:hypothetical protein
VTFFSSSTVGNIIASSVCRQSFGWRADAGVVRLNRPFLVFSASANSFRDWTCVIAFRLADGGLELPGFLTQARNLSLTVFSLRHFLE